MTLEIEALALRIKKSLILFLLRRLASTLRIPGRCSHLGLLGKYHIPTLSLTVVIQLLVHSFSRTDPVCPPKRKPKVPAIRQTSSKVLKKYMVTYRMKKKNTYVIVVSTLMLISEIVNYVWTKITAKQCTVG